MTRPPDNYRDRTIAIIRDLLTALRFGIAAGSQDAAMLAQRRLPTVRLAYPEMADTCDEVLHAADAVRPRSVLRLREDS